MAVDYTKVFTIIGKYADKVKDYYAYIDTQNTDKAAIETVLAAQSVVYLGDGLTEMYDSLKGDVSSWTDELISRVSDVLTDEALIGANFSFGSLPSLDEVWPVLIKDMNTNDKNVTASVATVGSASYTTEGGNVGKVAVGTLLDGVSPPLSGAPAIVHYMGLTTQLTPTSETITLTCQSDGEHGVTRGSETFIITGTGPQSEAYDPLGENIGSPGTISLADTQAGNWLTNPSFDEWEDNEPVGWENGGGVGGVDYEETNSDFYDPNIASAISFLVTDTAAGFQQTLDKNQFERGKAYFISCWARKDIDSLADQAIEISLSDDGGTIGTILTAQPTTTGWTHYYVQIVIPMQIEGELILGVSCSNESTNDPVSLDQIVIVPCEYHAGVALALFDGPEPFLIGDTITFTLSNDNAGEFQSFFRKAYKVQLPTDGSPTISDGLVA